MLRTIQLTLALLVGSVTAVLPTVASAAPADAVATSSPLVTTEQLKSLLARPDVRVLDIRPGADYAAGHIPGAISTPYGAFRGPADNPGALKPENELTELLRKAGIDGNTHVVVAHAGSNQTDFGAAARVYWTLKVGGLTRLSVLDGGTLGWQAAGGELDTAAASVTPSTFTYRYDQSMIVSTEEVAAAVEGGQSALLLDARPASFFTGEQRHDGAARYGTLPGAQNLEHASFFNADGKTLKPADDVRAIAERAGVAAKPVVSFCNTGHWAATNWFVLSELAGNREVKLYPTSMVEWSKTDLPMENQPSRVTSLLRDAKRALSK